jgi:membrane-associated phospholipid phosphatase
MGEGGGRWSVDHRLEPRGLWTAALLLVLFVLWTLIVRVGISQGSRESASVEQSFGSWPSTIESVAGSSDIQFSIFATYNGGRPIDVSEQPVPAIVGRPMIGTFVDSFDSENMNGSRFVTGPHAGPVTSLSIYVSSPIDRAPHDRFELAIYDDHNGAPNRRLAVSERGTLRPDAWNTVAINATLDQRTPYWFFYNTNGTSDAVNSTVYVPVAGSPLDDAIHSIGSTAWASTADRLTFLGNQWPATLMLCALAVVAARRRLRSGLALLVGFAASLLVAMAVRELVFHPFGEYPSGHALRSAYVVLAAAALVRRRSFDIVGGLVVVLICAAAVYTRRHYGEEIIGGLLLAGAAAALALGIAPLPGSDPRAPISDRA